MMKTTTATTTTKMVVAQPHRSQTMSLLMDALAKQNGAMMARTTAEVNVISHLMNPRRGATPKVIAMANPGPIAPPLLLLVKPRMNLPTGCHLLEPALAKTLGPTRGKPIATTNALILTEMKMELGATPMENAMDKAGVIANLPLMLFLVPRVPLLNSNPPQKAVLARSNGPITIKLFVKVNVPTQTKILMGHGVSPTETARTRAGAIAPTVPPSVTTPKIMMLKMRVLLWLNLVI